MVRVETNRSAYVGTAERKVLTLTLTTTDLRRPAFNLALEVGAAARGSFHTKGTFTHEGACRAVFDSVAVRVGLALLWADVSQQ